MNRLREAFETRPDHRAGDLMDCPCEQYPCVNDEALIAWAEELQTQPERPGLNWHVLIGWPVMIAVGLGCWWVIAQLIF